jgi:hypothetical protein
LDDPYGIGRQGPKTVAAQGFWRIDSSCSFAQRVWSKNG